MTPRPLISARGMGLSTLDGRPLIRDLNFTLTRDKVAVIGRNGVGKSTLLAVLAGHSTPSAGRVMRHAPAHIVPQHLGEPAVRCVAELVQAGVSERRIATECARAGLDSPDSLARRPTLSGGERRKLNLVAAFLMRPALMLLDEPTQDIDASGRDWLIDQIERWDAGLVLVSHDRRLLRYFQHFFVVAESGCEYFCGPLDELDAHLQAAHLASEIRYSRNLGLLAARERQHVKVCRRRERKKNVGRIHELDRAQSRARLNTRRGAAQVSQGRAAGIRDSRINGVRDWAKATRRALAVNLPLAVVTPDLPADDGVDNVVLDGVSAVRDGRLLFEGIDLKLGRGRLGVTGPNGSGKTTLLGLMTGQWAPTRGRAHTRFDRVGSIAQGATDWMDDESLLSRLALDGPAQTELALAELVVAHRFPLALAARPLGSLSPGERVRAALVCLLQRRPTVEMLVLDEPTFGLDFVGLEALRTLLAAWPGGLVVVTHDTELLDAIGLKAQLVLDGAGGHEMRTRSL